MKRSLIAQAPPNSNAAVAEHRCFAAEQRQFTISKTVTFYHQKSMDHPIITAVSGALLVRPPHTAHDRSTPRPRVPTPPQPSLLRWRRLY